MERIIDFEYNGLHYEAYCPAAAIFDIYEHFGKVGPVLEITGMNQDTREGFDACCWLLAEFCRWGELRRRHLGETPRDMLTVAALQLAPPAELPRMRVTVMEAVAAGFRRDIPDEEAEAKERDLILEELDGAQKKKRLRRGASDTVPRHSGESVPGARPGGAAPDHRRAPGHAGVSGERPKEDRGGMTRAAA